jgi:hypothetical protein
LVSIKFSIRKKKKFDFRNTLNHFIFVKFIPRIYDIVHYKHFFRDHNNLVILKKRKKNSRKNIFFDQYCKNVIITSKVKGEGIKVVSIGKSYSNRASQRKHQTFKKQRHQTQFK